MSEQPKLLAPRLEAVPDELRALDQWVVWAAEWKDDPKHPHGGKWNKVPKNARNGRAASHSDPLTWSTFEEAARAYEGARERYAGIGFVFHEADPYAGIDLDESVVSNEDGRALTAFAARVVAELGSYAEVSPSGTGIKIIVRAALPPGSRRRDNPPPKVEMYDAARFFTVTGRRWAGTPDTAEACQAKVEALHAEIFPAPSAEKKRGRPAKPSEDLPQNDGDLLTLAYQATNGPKIQALYSGDTSAYNGDRSAADLALCSLLAFYTGDDSGRLHRLFCASGLYRDKWDTPHYSDGRTYGEATVQKAIAGCTEFYNPRGGRRQGKEQQEERRQRRAEASHAAKTADDLPVIETNDRHIRDVAEDALTALREANRPPAVFVRSNRLARIAMSQNPLDGKVRPQVETVTREILSHRLARIANCVSTSLDRGTVPIAPPERLLKDLLAYPSWPDFPPLLGVVTAPVVATNGELVTTPGYIPAARVYYHQVEPLPLPDTTPTDANVSAAKMLLLDTLLGDFPFVDEASRAHALALLLLPFVRPYIPGNTPLHLVDAPTRGTGKTLLVDTVTSVFLPGGAPHTAIPKKQRGASDEEEWGKKAVSELRDGVPFVFLDNITGVLASPTLDLLLTSSEYKGRLLGTNDPITLPVRCVWVGTANNVEVGGDTDRRIVWIRMDSKQEQPEDREGFKVPDLPAYVREERPALVAAAVTLLRAWIAKGRPVWSGRPVGSYEQWSRIMGGILETVGVPGFLLNRQEMNQRLNPERERWADLFTAWHGAHGENAVGVAEVADLAQSLEIIADTDRAGKTTLGAELRRRVDGVFGGFRLTRAEKKQNAARYCVTDTRPEKREPREPREPFNTKHGVSKTQNKSEEELNNIDTREGEGFGLRGSQGSPEKRGPVRFDDFEEFCRDHPDDEDEFSDLTDPFAANESADESEEQP